MDEPLLNYENLEDLIAAVKSFWLKKLANNL